MAPVQQQVVVVERLRFLLALDVVAEQRSQLALPFGTPGEILLQAVLQRFLRIDTPRVDRETGVLLRKTTRRLRQSQLVARDIHQVGCIATVENREARIEAEVMGELSQQAIADRMKGARPGQDAGRQWAVFPAGERLPQYRLDAARHFHRCAARERQQQDAPGIDALDDEVGDSMRQRHGLAGARARNDQQRSGIERCADPALAEGCGLALRRIQRIEVVVSAVARLHHALPKICIFIQYWLYLQGKASGRAAGSPRSRRPEHPAPRNAPCARRPR